MSRRAIHGGYALWQLTLLATCPACQDIVDLLDAPDFWDGRTLEPCQRAFDIEVVCPKCGAEFQVDCEH
jgi:hypothetical protein